MRHVGPASWSMSMRGHILGIEIRPLRSRGGRISQVDLVEEIFRQRALAEQTQLVFAGYNWLPAGAASTAFNPGSVFPCGLGRCGSRVHVDTNIALAVCLAFSSFSQSRCLRGCRRDVTFSASAGHITTWTGLIGGNLRYPNDKICSSSAWTVFPARVQPGSDSMHLCVSPPRRPLCLPAARHGTMATCGFVLT
jgi:hypothetical protein